MSTTQDTLQVVAEFKDNASAAIQKLQASMGQVGANAKTSTAGVNDLNQALDKTVKLHAGVNRELLVLAHELSQGNFQRFGGSLLVLGEQTNALGGAFKLLAAGGGVVGGAFLALVAAVGTVGLAFYQAGQQAKQFNADLALSNNYAGLTSDTFKQLSTTIAKDLAVSYGTASEAVLGLVKTGKFTADQLGVLAKVIINDNRLTGVSIADLTKEYDKLADGPTKFVNNINSQRNIFSGAQQEQIRLLEETGHKQEAVTLALKVFSDYQRGPAAEAIKNSQGLLRDLADGFGILWASIKRGVGAEKLPLVDQLKAVNDEILRLKINGPTTGTVDALGNFVGGNGDQELLALQAKRTAILRQLAAEQKKEITDSNNAFNSKLAQETQEYFGSLGVKGAQSLKIALAKFDEEVKKQRLSNPTSEYNDPAFLAAARQKVIEANRNPIENKQDRQIYAGKLADLDGYIREEQDYYKTRQLLIKADLDKGLIDQQTADKMIHDLRINDLGDQMFYTQAKLKLAQAEAKRTNGEEAVRDVAKFNADLKHLQNEQLIANAQYEADLAKQAKQINTLYQQMVNEIDKASAARSTAVQRELNKETLSSNEALFADAKNAVTDRFEAIRQRVIAEYKAKGASDEQLARALDKISEEQKHALADEQGYYDRRLAIQGDWKVGAIKAFKDYQQEANDVAKQSAQLVTSLTKSVEDAIFNFAQTGKFSLKELVASFTTAINQLVAKALAAKLQEAVLGSFVGSGGNSGFIAGAASFLGSLFGGARASGGPVQSGKAYLVGENGPEPFIPSGNGTILPNSSLMGGGTSLTQHISIHAIDAKDVLGKLTEVKRGVAELVNSTNTTYKLKGAY